jgi:hypothetical protein
MALYTLQWSGISRFSSRYNFVLYWITIAGLCARMEWWQWSVVLSISFVIAEHVEPEWDLVCYLFPLSSKTSYFLAKLLRCFGESYWKEKLHVGNRMWSLLYSNVQRRRIAIRRTPNYCRLACFIPILVVQFTLMNYKLFMEMLRNICSYYCKFAQIQDKVKYFWVI